MFPRVLHPFGLRKFYKAINGIFGMNRRNAYYALAITPKFCPINSFTEFDNLFGGLKMNMGIRTSTWNVS